MVATPTRRGTGARERRPSNEVHRPVGVTLRFCGAIAVVMLLWLGQISQPGKVLADTPEDWMPDAILRAAVRQELNVPEGVVLQRRDMQQITGLTIPSMAITDPTGLEHATGLTTLVALDNQISDLRPLASLERLRFLDLGGNQLTEHIPVELGWLTNLKVLDLSSNRLSRRIPHQLGSLTSLETLNLQHNRLWGQIPGELGDMTSLKRLVLRGNGLSGEIPPQLGQLPSLMELNLSKNRLSGEVPAELGALTELVHLFVGDNQISGCLPAQWQSLETAANDLEDTDLEFCS